jgi:hypothetical protein
VSRTLSNCWKAGWSVRKDGNVYQKKDPAAELFTKPAKPAPVAAPAPIGNQAPDHRVALALGLAGGPGPNPGNAAGAIPDKNADALLREMAQALARIALNSNDIVNMLARIEKMVSPAPYNEENGPV